MDAATAAARLLQFDTERERVILGSLDKVGRLMLRYSITEFMEGLGTGQNARPPNPPPGPIGIRTGNLRRALAAMKSNKNGEGGAFQGGLILDLDKAPYGRIHELGGTTKPHRIEPRNAKMLRWRGIGPAMGKPSKGGGFDIFARGVNHPGSVIPPRPFMAPAGERVEPEAVAIIDADLEKLLRRLVG
jgi:hypothetical protein